MDIRDYQLGYQCYLYGCDDWNSRFSPEQEVAKVAGEHGFKLAFKDCLWSAYSSCVGSTGPVEMELVPEEFFEKDVGLRDLR